MGFKTVFRTLLELFPQVDSRILRAVAIEHSKDADKAADDVISNVLPLLAQQPIISSPVYDGCKPGGVSSERAEREGQISSLSDQVVLGSRDKEYTCKTDLFCNLTHQEKASSSTPPVFDHPIADTNQLQGNIDNEELILLVGPRHHEKIQSDRHHEKIQSGTDQTSEIKSNAFSCEEITDHIQVCDTIETEVPVSLGKCQYDDIGTGDEKRFQVISPSSTLGNDEFVDSSTNYQGEQKDSDGPLPDDSDMSERGSEIEPCVGVGKSAQVEPCVDCGKSDQVEQYLDGVNLEVKNSVAKGTPDAAAEVGFQSELSDTPNCCKSLKFNQDIRIDFLEDIVEAAKNNKKTLFLAMDSIMNMMRQVELQEEAAEEAKEEAAIAGLDILTKVNELKQMLAHAKEANDMHAGEVYGERAILATEVRELQARLLSLSDERDKALAIIDEMHHSLEERLATAEELKKTAEKQKLEKEEAAREALAEQEAIMDKVVQESKILQEEADENSKLREFLMDRGCVVDTLQGEISVICQDVRLLKQRFDERVPLSKSISSCQTSCILASSGSSLKSIASDLVLESRETSKSPKEGSPTSSIDGRSLKSPKERSPTSSINDQSSKSLKERSPTSSIDGQLPKSSEGRSPTSSIDGGSLKRMNHEMVLDDDWELFE